MEKQSAVVVTVEVLDEPVSNTSYTDKQGKPAVLTRQKIYFHQTAGYPLPGEIMLRDGRSPYQPGRYLIAGEVFRAGVRNGKDGRGFVQLTFSDMDMQLVPLDAAIAQLTGKPARAAA